MTRRCLAGCLAAAIALMTGAAAASPGVSLDDPVYDELDQRELAGELPAFHGGLIPLSAARIQALMPEALSLPTGWWLRPLDRAALRLDLVHESPRTYSTEARPRTVAGLLALSCEDQEGRPCGPGAGLAAELDAAAGYGALAAGAVRLRAQTGGDRYDTALAVDRAYLHGELGPIAAEIGRDVLVLGPATHAQLGWGRNAPPLDQLRLSGARPLALSRYLDVNAIYVVGRLAAPQTYPGALVTVARGELTIDGRFVLGAMQLLELGGDGAPRLGFADFVLEHVRRRDLTASETDSSNRRVGFDVSAHIAGFGGARIVYQVVFEDLRKHVVDAARYDADHVLSVQTRWLTVEWQHTGMRAYEHIPRLTGFTSGGRIVGDPLGPAAQAVFVGGRIPLGWGVLSPWAEVARLASDSYELVESGPIIRTSGGTSELRFRIGARARIPLGDDLELTPEAALEEVERASFVTGARDINAVFRAVLVWRPSANSATLRGR